MKPFPVTRSSFLFVFLIISCVVGSFFAGCKKSPQTGPPPPDVEVVSVQQKDVPIFTEWVGTMDGLVNATIRAQVSGYLIKQNYREGEVVKKGQVLFEIDPRSFAASVGEAKGQLAQAEARWQTTKANLARVKPLAAQNAVSKKDLDDAVGAEEASHASTLVAKANLDKAQLELEWTRITSPIEGIAGIAKAQIGNLVGPGSTEELTTVSTVDPIKVYMQVSEQQYLKTKSEELEKRETQVREIPLQLILADGSVYPHQGQFSLADRQVDMTTGTIKVATLFPNPGNFLRPGQFARVRAQMDVKKGALLVPQRAVTEMQGKYLVAVIEKDNKVNVRPVQVAEKVSSDVIISQGLKPGEKVVAEGIQKVKSGQMVTPKPFAPEKPAVASGDSGRTEAKPSPAPMEKR
jgi:membrane fusion protein (multidrug efflux system)